MGKGVDLDIKGGAVSAWGLVGFGKGGGAQSAEAVKMVGAQRSVRRAHRVVCLAPAEEERGCGGVNATG